MVIKLTYFLGLILKDCILGSEVLVSDDYFYEEFTQLLF